ncbi:MAG TPA: hypothetical protein VGJ73_20060 [Verrucomicrobiae bacterium]
MKRTIVILAVATASMVAFAQPPPNPAPLPSPASASVSPPTAPLVKKEIAQVPAPGVSTPLKSLRKPLVKRKVWSVDGTSSRPWGQIVGIHPGYSAFPAPEMHESSFYLFWVGRDPH